MNSLAVSIFIFAVFLSQILLAQAEDFPGGDSSANLEETLKKGFSAEGGMQDEDKKALDSDRLKIGGKLQAEWQIYTIDKSASRKDFVTNPMTLEMYLDSQLKDDVRSFFRGRLIHDGSIDESTPSPITGLTQKQTTSSLDEMKLSLNTNKRIYWTLGKQKIKWGASKFWNPTDFINNQKRDFLKSEDVRSGITMIKAHIPWRDTNSYLIGVTDTANETNQTGAAARIEVPLSAAEWTFSSYSRKGQPTKFGTDVSFALGDFDLYLEWAESNQQFDKSASGGLTYQFKYSDDDTVSLGLEGFWQENGYDNKSSYSTLVANNKFVPFFLGRTYGLLTIFLPKPGVWNDSSFMCYAFLNGSDKSQFYRLTWSYEGYSDLRLMAALGARAGESGTEMKYFNQGMDAYFQMKVEF